jgi:hypothetical protein
MAEKVVLDYLEKYYGKYNFQDLKNKIISAGYSVEDIEQAMKERGINERQAIQEKTQVQDSYIGDMHSKSKSSGGCKVGAISGIAFLFLCFLSIILFYIFSEIREVPIIIAILEGICLILFFYGFVCLGKKYDEGLLKVVGWILITIGGILTLFQFLVLIFPNLIGEFMFGALFDSFIPGSSGNISSMIASLGILIVISFVLALVYFIMFILLGVGLIKLKKESRLAKITGILTIVGTGGLLLLGLGILVLLVAFVFAIVLFFKQSKDN